MIEALRRAAVGAETVEFWLVSAALAGLAVFALRKGLDGFWRLRTILDTPTARIRSAPQGYVELTGRALPYRGNLTAPLTGLACVWYRFKVEEHRGSGKSSHWVTIDQGEADIPFLLDDTTGRCLVEPADAQMNCRESDTWYGGNRHQPAPRQRGGWLQLIRRYRFSEVRILDSEPVYLLGRFETPRRGVQDRDRLARHLLAGWKRDRLRMERFDTDGDGEISVGEWEDARVEAQGIAAHAESTLQAEPPLSRVGKTSNPRHPFVISTHGEGPLQGRLQLQAMGGTLAFLLLASGVAFAVLARLAGT